MGGQLEEFTKNVIGKVLEESYPHLKLPAVVYAIVTGVKELSDTYEVKELEVVNDDSGGSYRGHIVAHWYEYTLGVIDRFGNGDETFPALPGVRSKVQLKTGNVVAVGLAFGDIAPAIIGEVVL